MVHARLLLARGEIPQAQDELEEALSMNADSASALALVADLAYRAQEWDRARTAYTRLAQIPGAGAALSAHTLAYRRAELAEMFGDHAEAETAYREVVALDPQHDGAREAVRAWVARRGRRDEAGSSDDAGVVVPGVIDGTSRWASSPAGASPPTPTPASATTSRRCWARGSRSTTAWHSPATTA